MKYTYHIYLIPVLSSERDTGDPEFWILHIPIWILPGACQQLPHHVHSMPYFTNSYRVSANSYRVPTKFQLYFWFFVKGGVL